MNIENLANHICFEDIFKNNKNEDGSYNWLNISKTENLPIGFIDKYFHQINGYRNLEKSGNLSNHIIKKYGNFLNWNILLMNQFIDEELIEAFSEKINFKICVMFQDLSINFLIKYKEKFKLKDLEKNTKINPGIINAFKNYLAGLDK